MDQVSAARGGILSICHCDNFISFLHNEIEILFHRITNFALFYCRGKTRRYTFNLDKIFLGCFKNKLRRIKTVYKALEKEIPYTGNTFQDKPW